MTDGMGSDRTGTEKIGTNRRTKRADAEMTDADRIDAERIEADERAIRYSGFAPEERTTATLRSLQTARDYKAWVTWQWINQQLRLRRIEEPYLILRWIIDDSAVEGQLDLTTTVLGRLV